MSPDSLADYSDSIEWQRYNMLLPDGGPIYAETDLERFIVEPWNAYSSLLIVLPALVWAVRLKGKYLKYPFLSYCMPLLFLGGTGSTLFHAFRTYPLFLYLDVLPTLILTLSIAVYFWIKILGKWWHVLFLLIPAIGLRLLANHYLSAHTAVNFTYGITGTLIFIPLILLAYRTGFRKSIYLWTSLIAFLLSLFFREIDARTNIQILPMGTHFLWHAFTGVGAYLMGHYLYFIQSVRMKGRKEVS